MRTIGVYDAKRRFGTLLAEVERGETFLITRYGTPVAYMEPMRHEPNDAAVTVEERHESRQQRDMTLDDEGRQEGTH
jgi:prevent-host-death family protein